MKTAIALFVTACAIAPTAHAMDARLRGQFEKLDPQTRMEQRCDLEAMNRIKAAKLGYRPDKVIAYSFGDPVTADNVLKAKGAVFRSEGEWYRLAFKCETTPDRFDVTTFKFRIGEMVAREDWDAHYLYD
ncbi:DUF930 domain-containing protein [Rhizobium sp. ARZ01]|uniref:DUF930 domain-containing protein n=1 Tax=Rhizobium sp. ARZ01 TaxID=2769313 RepID=UPI00177B7837|nr:DUF930 domain-containing protein [Rhizobium sp. ARZ01]MBD9371471.1 DUF930 domain-containing protein [Rhizobium sp. ARZ01]